MLIVDVAEPSAPSAVFPLCRQARGVVVTCREFTIGKDDWNRGVRELRRVFATEGRIAYLVNGSLRLSGLPIGDIILDAAEVSRVLSDGLQIRSHDLEAEITAADFRNTLLPIPVDGRIADPG